MSKQNDYKSQFLTYVKDKEGLGEEGKPGRVYEDPNGNNTIGYGFNMDDKAARTLWNGAFDNKLDFDVYKSAKEDLTKAQSETLLNYVTNIKDGELATRYKAAWTGAKADAEAPPVTLSDSQKLMLLDSHYNLPKLIKHGTQFHQHLSAYLETGDIQQLAKAAMEIGFYSNGGNDEGIRKRRLEVMNQLIQGSSLSIAEIKSEVNQRISQGGQVPTGYRRAYFLPYTVSHTVELGEVLSVIAQKYNTDVETLLKMNPELADNRNKLKEGQIIIIGARDTDGDGAPDSIDNDIDGDSIPNLEDDTPLGDDPDGDGLPNIISTELDMDSILSLLADNNNQVETERTTLNDLLSLESDSLKAAFKIDMTALERVIATLYEGIQIAERYNSPLILDLDGDGVETLSQAQGIHFDLDVNGFAELTGWAAADDGLLVRDINGNGTIDNGSELFGNYTLLNDGAKAANGFIALAGLDSNDDGIINSDDSAFNELRVWQDSNSDGISQQGELVTLSDAGVSSLNTTYTSDTRFQFRNHTDEQGNQHRQQGHYTRSDGSTAALHDVWFNIHTADTVQLTTLTVDDSIAALPNIQGFGNVASLHQAMAQDSSGELQQLVAHFIATPDIMARQQMMPELLYRWAGVWELGEFDRIDPSRSAIPGQIRAGLSVLKDGRKLAALEAFTGHSYYQHMHEDMTGPHAAVLLNFLFHDLSRYAYSQLSAQSHDQQHYQHIHWQTTSTAPNQLTELDISSLLPTLPLGSSATEDRLYLADLATNLAAMGSIGQQVLAKLASLDQTATHELWLAESQIYFFDHHNDRVNQEKSIYGNSTHGRLSTYSGSIDHYILFGFAGDDRFSGNLGNDQLYGGRGQDVLGGGAGDDWLVGGADNDQLSGNTGDDQLYGDAGSDWLKGGAGNDTLTGGADDDTLLGNAGNDRYHWGWGDGNDTIHDYYNSDPWDNEDDHDTLIFGAGITAENLSWSRKNRDMLVTLSDNQPTRQRSPQTLTLKNWFNGSRYQLEQLQLNDGTVLDKAQITAVAHTIVGSETSDRLYGFNNSADTLKGLAGNDQLYGHSGDDRLIGGAGDDIVSGGTGSDTYVWGWGDGSDKINDYDSNDSRNSTHQDTVIFGVGINASDIVWSRNNSHLVATLTDETTSNQTLTINNWFSNVSYQVEQLQLNDGTVLDKAEVVAAAHIIRGSVGNDRLTTFANTDSQLLGLAGNDQLYGNSGNDRLVGGAGDDTVSGGTGSDTYLWGWGDGNDKINDYNYQDSRNNDHQDTLIFGSGITASDINWSRKNSHLVATLTDETGTDQTLTLNNWFSGEHYQVEQLQLSDGTLLNKTEIAAAVTIQGSDTSDYVYGFYNSDDKLLGLAGNDRLYARSGDDQLTGGSGNDWLQGDSGDDSYYFSAGHGHDTVSDSGRQDYDSLVYDASFDHQQLTIEQQQNHLKIGFLGDDANSVTLNNGVQQVNLNAWQLKVGSYLLNQQQLKNYAQLSSSFAAPDKQLYSEEEKQQLANFWSQLG